jgi:hypothetical protein
VRRPVLPPVVRREHLRKGSHEITVPSCYTPRAFHGGMPLLIFIMFIAVSDV